MEDAMNYPLTVEQAAFSGPSYSLPLVLGKTIHGVQTASGVVKRGGGNFRHVYGMGIDGDWHYLGQRPTARPINKAYIGMWIMNTQNMWWCFNIA